MSRISEKKFVDHIVHFYATKWVAPFLKREGREEDYQYFSSLSVENAKDELFERYDWRALSALSALRALSDLSALSALRALSALSALRALSELRDLSALRALSDLSALSALSDLRDLSALRTELASEYLDAYEYAGGKRSDFTVKTLDTKQLAAIEKGKWEFDMGTWYEEQSCGTTLCLYGGAAALCKRVPFAQKYGFEITGAMIYFASIGEVPDPYESTESALANLKARAESTAA